MMVGRERGGLCRKICIYTHDESCCWPPRAQLEPMYPYIFVPCKQFHAHAGAGHLTLTASHDGVPSHGGTGHLTLTASHDGVPL